MSVRDFYARGPQVSIADDENTHMYSPDYFPCEDFNQPTGEFHIPEPYLPYDGWSLAFNTPIPDMGFHPVSSSQARYQQISEASLVSDHQSRLPFNRSFSSPSNLPGTQFHQPIPQHQYRNSSFLQSSVRSSASPCLSATNTVSSTAESFASAPSAGQEATRYNGPRQSTSPVSSLAPYGIAISPNGPWRCAYPSCNSRALFNRGCDLRKHYNRHSKHLYCRVEGCPQSEPFATAEAADTESERGFHGTRVMGGSKFVPYGQTHSVGFSSKKDRARHEAKHNPSIRCEWSAQTDEYGNPRDPLPGESRHVRSGHVLGETGIQHDACGRIFSRMDNMKDHVRRVHKKGLTERPQRGSKKRS